MDKEESIGKVEHLLRTRKYTEFERNRLVDLTNEKWGTIFDKSRGKFQQASHIHQYGITLYKRYYDVIPENEEDDHVV